MTNLQLLEAIGMLSDETVLDAEQPVARVLSAPGRKWIRQIAAVAACVCLLFCGAVLTNWGSGGAVGESSSPFEPNMPQDGSPTHAAGGSTTEHKAEATTAGATAAPEEVWTTTTAVYTTTTTAATYATTTTVGGHAVPTTTTGNPSVLVPAEGLNVYCETFDRLADTEDTAAALRAAGMSRVEAFANGGGEGAYSETNAAFALRGGRLYFDNITPEGSGKDGYYTLDVLMDPDLTRVVGIGRYTLQYDLEYVDAADPKRYAVLITELSEDGQCYNSFHLRINGVGNHQCHFYGSWKTYSAYDPATDLNPSADDPTGAEGTPLIQKLLGPDAAQAVDQCNLAGVRFTVRLQWDPEMGHHVYLKTADMTEFIKVSEPSVKADGPMYIGWDGWYVALKLGGGIAGYLDNIHLWTGWGEEPSPDAAWWKPLD